MRCDRLVPRRNGAALFLQGSLFKFLEGDPVPSHNLEDFLRFVEENDAKQAPDDSSYLRRFAED